jgi:hypothetical protein
MIASGRQRVGISFFVDRDRFEAIVAGAAEPEEGCAARTALDPIGSRNRLAALGTGITTRQIAGVESSHRRISLLIFCYVLLFNGMRQACCRNENFVAEKTSLHLDCVLCTTILRVRMTQFRVDRRDASHAQRRRHARRVRWRERQPQNLAAMSSAFRHIPAR